MRLASSRQPIAIAVALLAAALLAIGLPAVVRGERRGEAVASAKPEPLPGARVLHPATFERLGLRVLRPEGWRAWRRGHTITLRSSDRAAAVTIAVQPRWVGTDVMRRRAIRAVRGTYDGARRTGRRARRFGARRVRGIHFDVRGEQPRLDVAVIAASSRWRSYALTAVRSQDAPAARLLEERAVLRSATFARPPRR